MEKDPALRDGAWFAPVVMEGLKSESPSSAAEFFGPVFNLYRVKNAEKMLELANDSDYGLGSAVFTANMTTAQDFALNLSVGSVAINSMMGSFSELPSGGIKGSGFGRECFSDGLHEIGHIKAVINPSWE